MKNIIQVIVIIFICFPLVACANNAANMPMDFTDAPATGRLTCSPVPTVDISEKDAIDKVRNCIIDSENYLRFVIDREQEVKGQQYFVVHVYSESTQALEDEGTVMTFTFGWYFVNKNTGKPYLAYAALDEVLIPFSQSQEIVDRSGNYEADSAAAEQILSNKYPEAADISYDGIIKRNDRLYYWVTQFEHSEVQDKYYLIDQQTKDIYLWDTVKDELFIE